jgi:nitrate reductase gamma subunit
MNTLNNFFFIALPYIAFVVFLIGTISRYRSQKFKVSSLSSQFLEGKKLFWGSVPFHWGILILFFGHLVAFLIPKSIILWNSEPLRLLFLEISSFIAAICVFIGLILLYIRRMTDDRVKMVTTKMDIFIELLLLFIIFSGMYTAVFFRWGSSWFASVMSPYLKSIFTFSPDITAISVMPLMFKLHVISAYLIILMTPFTRLVHFLVYPLNYIWKPYQQVIWPWNKHKVRSPRTPWSIHRPKNN